MEVIAAILFIFFFSIFFTCLLGFCCCQCILKCCCGSGGKKKGENEEPLISEAEEKASKALDKLNELSNPFAHTAFPCLRGQAEEALINLVKSCGENAEQDKMHATDDFSLFSGTYPGTEPDVELEDTTTVEMQQRALERMKEFFHPLIPVGCVLYALSLGGGYFSGLFCDCSKGPATWGFGFAGLAVCIQMYWLNKMTILISQSSVEGRPLLRLLKTLEGLDNYHVMSVLAAVDTFSRFTRAQFVGYLQHCNAGVDKPFTEVFQYDGVYGEMMDMMGIEGLAFWSFITGPILIQFGYMWFLKNKLDREREEARAKVGKTDEEGEIESMEITDSIDDLGALMSWATLTPAGKVIDLAAVPLDIEDDEDVHRLWDRMLTFTWVTAARNIPDGVIQMTLQAWFLCLVYPGIDFSIKAQLLLNIILASVGVVADSIDLIMMNRRATVLVGVALLSMMFFGTARTIGAFTCESSIVKPGFTIACIPNGLIDHGNWTSGALPG